MVWHFVPPVEVSIVFEQIDDSPLTAEMSLEKFWTPVLGRRHWNNDQQRPCGYFDTIQFVEMSALGQKQTNDMSALANSGHCGLFNYLVRCDY